MKISNLDFSTRQKTPPFKCGTFSAIASIIKKFRTPCSHRRGQILSHIFPFLRISRLRLVQTYAIGFRNFEDILPHPTSILLKQYEKYFSRFRISIFFFVYFLQTIQLYFCSIWNFHSSRTWSAIRRIYILIAAYRRDGSKHRWGLFTNTSADSFYYSHRRRDPIYAETLLTTASPLTRFYFIYFSSWNILSSDGCFILSAFRFCCMRVKMPAFYCERRGCSYRHAFYA